MMKKLVILFLSLFTYLVPHSQCEGVITYNVDVPPGPGSTYPPGSVVQLCVTMTGWDGNAQGSNWFEGFYMALGGGWETVTPTVYPEDAEGDGSGTWIWATSTISDNGATAGNGFYFEGPTGPLDGNAGNDWGDSCPSTTCVWSCCVELVAANGPSGLDLHIGVIPYSDGTMGSWGIQSCNETQTVLFEGSIGCFIPGCTDVTACNYDASADCDNGSCEMPGCTDPLACNYDLNAACDDGSCTYGGCTDPLACNFNPLAGCDDGSCGYFSMGNITHNFIPCPDTTCTGSEVMYSVTGDVNSTYEWNVTGGGLVTTDQTKDCEILWGDIPGTYTITVQEITAQGCIGQIKTCNVEVIIPDITFVSNSYSMCLNGSENLVAQPVGGSWSSEFMNGNTFVGTKPGTYHPSYLTNIHGCDIQEEVEVVVKRKYEAPGIIYSSELIDLCFDSGVQIYVADDTVGVTYGWFIDDVKQPFNENFMEVEWSDTTRTYMIKVIAYDEIGCESEPKLISVRTESCQRFFAPNSFTPNGDGTNDIFEVRGLSVYRPTLKIFNRWGVVVYVSNDLFWTGDSGSGYYCENGIYNWIIEYKDKFGQNREDSGYVTLIR
jgi:gliding motility-associated-like protein